jgi:hypothetical protein
MRIYSVYNSTVDQQIPPAWIPENGMCVVVIRYLLTADRRKKTSPHPLARTRSRKSTRVIASRSHGCMSQKSLHSTPAFTLRNVLEISTLHPLVQGLNERLSPANARTLTRAVPETRTRT